MDDETITVVICTHLVDRWHHLQRAVASVEAQVDVDARALVVVDGDPALAELARRELGDRCQLAVRTERGGLSRARNTALNLVSTPLVAFLDDDAEADPRWLASLRRELRPGVVGVGGRSEPAWDGGTPPPWFPEELLWTVGCSYRGLPGHVARVRNVFGGCALFRTSLFHEIGGFRADLGRQATGADGCEETELCLRATALRPGAEFVYTPHAVIHHHVPAGRATARYVLRRSLAEGRSKATLVRVGPTRSRGLSTEVSYLRRTLLPGIAAGGGALLRGDLDGVRRAALLAASAGAAGWAFARERLRHRAARAGTGPVDTPVITSPAARAGAEPTGQLLDLRSAAPPGHLPTRR